MTEADKTKKILVQMEIAIFKIPPCEDLLVIGKKAPIGKNAAMKMLETVAPDQFEVIEVENPIIEAIVAKRGLIKLMGRDRLIQVVIEEVTPLMEDSTLLHIGLNVKLLTTTTVEVPDDSSA